MNRMKQLSDEEISLAIRYLDPEINGDGEFAKGHSWRKKAGHWAGIALLVLAISFAVFVALWSWIPSVVRPEIPVQ
jgi:hypothetical protein